MLCRKCRSINLNTKTNKNGLYVYCQDCQAFQKYIHERDWETICAERESFEREPIYVPEEIPITQKPYKVRYQKDDFLKGIIFCNSAADKKLKKGMKKRYKKHKKQTNKNHSFSKKMTTKQIQELRKKVKALK